VRLAARIEQEVRAYPRLYAAFYGLVTAHPRARALMGRARDEVRAVDGGGRAAPVPADDPAVVAARGRMLRIRLGLF
jgi:hypothetical protein